MEERNSRTETGYEFIPLPKAPERDPIPEILRDALEMKHFTLPKLPKKYRLPEVLQETSEPNTSPPALLPPTSPSHLPTKSKKVPPSSKPTPRVAPHLPPEKHDLSQVDTAIHSRTTPTQRSCSSALPAHTKTSKTNKNTCTCEKCHFDFEEREVFSYLPQNLASYLREEHQSLKRQNYPTQKVIEHGKEELELFKKYLPPHLLHKIELEHQEREQKSFAEVHVQKASSCGCASASSEMPQIQAINSSCLPPPKKAILQECCHVCCCHPCCCHPQQKMTSQSYTCPQCHCHPCCCHPQPIQKKSSCSNSCQPCCHSCCCCCGHQSTSCGASSPFGTTPSPTPIGQLPTSPGLPYGGPYGGENTNLGSSEDLDNANENNVAVPSSTLREAFQRLLKEMETWGIYTYSLKEIVDNPDTEFFETEPSTESALSQNFLPSWTFVKRLPGVNLIFDADLEKFRIFFDISTDSSEPLKMGDFYRNYGDSTGTWKMLTSYSEMAVKWMMRALYLTQCETCENPEPSVPGYLTDCCIFKAALANKNLSQGTINYYENQLQDRLSWLQERFSGQVCGGLLGLFLPEEQFYQQPVSPQLLSSPIYNIQTKLQNSEIFSPKNLNFSTKQLQYGEIRYQQTTPYEFGLKKDLENKLKLNELFSLLESWGLKITKNQKLNEARRKIPLRFGIFGQESAFFISQKYYVPTLTNKNEVSSKYGDGILDGMTIPPKTTRFLFRSEKKEKTKTSSESLEGLRKFYASTSPLLSEKEIEKKLEKFKFNETLIPYTDKELKNIIKKYPRELSETVYEYNFANSAFITWTEIPNEKYEYYKFSDNLIYNSNVHYLVLGMNIYLRNFAGIILKEETINYLLQGNFTTLSNKFNITNFEDLASTCSSHNQLDNVDFKELNGKTIYIPCLINIPKPEIMAFIHELIHYFHGITYLWKKTGTGNTEISDKNFKDDEEIFTYLLSSIIRLKGLLKMNSSLLSLNSNIITNSNIAELILSWTQCLNYFSSLLLEYQQKYPEWIIFARELGVIY